MEGTVFICIDKIHKGKRCKQKHKTDEKSRNTIAIGLNIWSGAKSPGDTTSSVGDEETKTEVGVAPGRVGETHLQPSGPTPTLRVTARRKETIGNRSSFYRFLLPD